MTKHARNDMTDEKLHAAQAAQEQADDKAQAKEAAQGDGTANPSVSLVAEGAGPVRVAGQSGLEHLKPGHTYEDRVRAQARSLGIPVDDSMSNEYIMWMIRMKASS